MLMYDRATGCYSDVDVATEPYVDLKQVDPVERRNRDTGLHPRVYHDSTGAWEPVAQAALDAAVLRGPGAIKGAGGGQQQQQRALVVRQQQQEQRWPGEAVDVEARAVPMVGGGGGGEAGRPPAAGMPRGSRPGAGGAGVAWGAPVAPVRAIGRGSGLRGKGGSKGAAEGSKQEQLRAVRKATTTGPQQSPPPGTVAPGGVAARGSGGVGVSAGPVGNPKATDEFLRATGMTQEQLDALVREQRATNWQSLPADDGEEDDEEEHGRSRRQRPLVSGPRMAVELDAEGREVQRKAEAPASLSQSLAENEGGGV